MVGIHLGWMSLLKIKSYGNQNKVYKDFIRNGRTETSYFKLHSANNTDSETIDKRKNDYNCHLASKLNSPETRSKTCWSILKSFYSGNKIPFIPPLLHNNKSISYSGKR